MQIMIFANPIRIRLLSARIFTPNPKYNSPHWQYLHSHNATITFRYPHPRHSLTTHIRAVIAIINTVIIRYPHMR
jgi:hypothetical protein